MSACLQRFQRRSQRANLPALREPGRPGRKGMGRAGRRCRSPGQRRQARRAARPARPAARARPLAGVVPAGRRAARPASWPAWPASTSRSRSPDRTSVPGPGRLCRRRRPPAGTPARCQDCPDPASPASAAHASSAFPRPGPGGMRRRPAVPDDRRVPAAQAPGRWQRMDAVPGHPGSATPGHQDLAAVLAGPSPALPPL